MQAKNKKIKWVKGTLDRWSHSFLKHPRISYSYKAKRERERERGMGSGSLWKKKTKKKDKKKKKKKKQMRTLLHSPCKQNLVLTVWIAGWWICCAAVSGHSGSHHLNPNASKSAAVPLPVTKQNSNITKSTKETNCKMHQKCKWQFVLHQTGRTGFYVTPRPPTPDVIQVPPKSDESEKCFVRVLKNWMPSVLSLFSFWFVWHPGFNFRYMWLLEG